MRFEQAMLYVAQRMAQGKHCQTVVTVIMKPCIFHRTNEQQKNFLGVKTECKGDLWISKVKQGSDIHIFLTDYFKKCQKKLRPFLVVKKPKIAILK